jgi:hypothetical protein
VTGSSETCGTPPDRLEVSAGHMCAWCDPSLLHDLLDVGVTWRFMAFRGSADSVLVGSPGPSTCRRGRTSARTRCRKPPHCS